MLLKINKIWLMLCVVALVQCNESPEQVDLISGAKDGFAGGANPFDPNVPDAGSSGSAFNPTTGGSSSNPINTKSSIEYKTLTTQLSTTMVNEWRSAHDATLSAQDRQFTKYIYLDQEFISDSTKINKARVGLFKALNHVAIDNTEVRLGTDVSDGHGVMFAIDTREFFGNRAGQKWGLISRPSLVQGMISAPQYNRLQPFNNESVEAASRVVYNVMAPDVYVQLIDTPAYEYVLQRELGFPQGQCEALASQKEAIVYGSRVACMRYTADGRIYWNTADDFDGREGDALPYVEFDVRDNSGRVSYAPQFRFDGMLNFPGAGTIASEAWVGMKNGFNAYYIWGNANQRRGRAETFVDDPDNVGYNQFNPNATSFQGHYLETGRSCISCHAQGPQSKPSDMAIAMENGTISGQALEAAKQFWSTNEELNGYYEESRLLFQKAMATVVLGVSDASESENGKLINGADGEPILMMVKVIDRTAR